MYAQTNACCMIVYHWAYLLYRTNTHTYASTYGHTFGRIRTSYCMFSWNHVKHHLNSMYGIITTQYNLPFISSTLCLFAHKRNPFDISHARTNTHTDALAHAHHEKKNRRKRTNIECDIWLLVMLLIMNWLSVWKQHHQPTKTLTHVQLLLFCLWQNLVVRWFLSVHSFGKIFVFFFSILHWTNFNLFRMFA